MKGYDKFPAHWNVRRLKQVVNIIMGQSPEGQYLNQSEGVEFHQGKIFFGDQIIRQSDTKTLSVTKIAPAYSVLLCVRAPVGKVNITDREICIGRGFAAIECRDDISFKFLYYMLQHYEDTFKQEATGSTFEAVTVATIKNLFIPVPPKDEQDQIARFLDWKITAIDKLIAIRREKLRNLAELKKALITREVTRGNWERVRLKRVCDVTLGKMVAPYPSSDADMLEEYVCAKDVHFDGVNLDNLKKMWFRPNEKEQYRIYDGDLLVVEGGSVGNCAIVTNLRGRSVYVQNSIHIIRPKDDKVIMPYVCYCLQYLCNTGYMKTVSNVATIAHYTKQKVLATPIPLLPITEQKRIANYLDRICAQIDSAITNFTQQIDTLKELKACLISDAVTGKIDVRNITVPEEEKKS